MKTLEKFILGACYGDYNVRRIKFLQPDDFQYYGELFKAIKEHGDMIEAIKHYRHLKAQMVGYSFLGGTYQPERLALRLLEYRFKQLFSTLLGHLSSNTQNPSEAIILNEIILGVPDSDIFDISDHSIEYLGEQASNTTKSRINNFLAYRDKRANEAKKIINEFS